MSKEVHTVCFVVTGEALTEAARDLLLSEEPGKAYRLLADNLDGDGAIEAALCILQGTHDLDGDSSTGIALVPARESESLRRFREDFRFIYAGRYRSQGVWYRPVAWITHYGPADGTWATKQLQEGYGGAGLRKTGYLRAKYYCEPNEEPVLLDLQDEGRVYVIFEACGELPHWMPPNNTAREALDDALAAGRGLDQRGPPPALESESETKPRRLSKAELLRREEEAERREAEREAECKRIGEEVRAKAGGDTFPLELKSGRVLTVPRAPFLRWALRRTEQAKHAPEWEHVAPIGLKMNLDNPDHTDWVLGSGLSLDEAYSDEVNEAAWDATFRFQEEMRQQEPPQKYAGIFAALQSVRDMSHAAATVVDAGVRTGVVGEDIKVFPDSSGDRVHEVGDAHGIIVEQGGPLAHFAVVSRGRGITVMRHAEACEIFPAGTRIELDPARGRILVLEDDDED